MRFRIQWPKRSRKYVKLMVVFATCATALYFVLPPCPRFRLPSDSMVIATSDDGSLLATVRRPDAGKDLDEFVIGAATKDRSRSRIGVWDTRTGRLIREVGASSDEVILRRTYFLPDGHTLVAGCSDRVQSWDLLTGKSTFRPVRGELLSLLSTESADQIAVVLNDAVDDWVWVEFVRLSSGTRLAKIGPINVVSANAKWDGRGYYIRISKDVRRAVTLERSVPSVDELEFKVWDLATSQVDHVIRVRAPDWSGFWGLSDDGQFLVVISGRNVQFWNVDRRLLSRYETFEMNSQEGQALDDPYPTDLVNVFSDALESPYLTFTSNSYEARLYGEINILHVGSSLFSTADEELRLLAGPSFSHGISPDESLVAYSDVSRSWNVVVDGMRSRDELVNLNSVLEDCRIASNSPIAFSPDNCLIALQRPSNDWTRFRSLVGSVLFGGKGMPRMVEVLLFGINPMSRVVEVFQIDTGKSYGQTMTWEAYVAPKLLGDGRSMITGLSVWSTRPQSPWRYILGLSLLVVLAVCLLRSVFLAVKRRVKMGRLEVMGCRREL